MAQPVSSPTARMTVLLQGHILDSLTLAKVIDRVQELGGEYELNDIRIGSLKKDISSVNLTLSAESEAKLQAILEDLRPYGAQVVEEASEDARLEAVTADGKLPDTALELKHPAHVKVGGRWIAVEGAADALAIVVNPQTGTACLKPQAELKAGEQVVACGQGVLWG